ncbi:MAG: TlpA disulfide reductase family protein [Acidimicrobiaceae bacterium]|nr:TlpA disulfide reductase family protein [Acidimicrobiaceae bacterium]MDE0498020.1 TlpA disulfide reductase family protein [Acidimicrobiaceae bacterium]
MRRLAMCLCAVLLAAACGGDDASEPVVTSAAAATTTPSGAAPDRTQVSGTALPQFEQLEDDPAVGRQAPLVVGADLLTGAEVRIESQGRPMVVAFYAHWCPHCQNEVEDLTGWLEANELPSGVDFYAVSVLEDATRGNHPPEKWLRDEGWQYPVVADTPAMSVVDAFGLVSVPYLVAVDADNEVVLRFAGNVGPAELAAFFTALLEPTS